MSCRIGVTTNLKDRQAYWKSKYPTLKNWQTLEIHDTKSKAQEAEIRLSKKMDATHHQEVMAPSFQNVMYTDLIIN